MNLLGKILVFALFLTLHYEGLLGQTVQLTSPNDAIQVNINVGKCISYSIVYDADTLLVNGRLSLTLNDRILGNNLKLKSKKRATFSTEIIREIPFKNRIIKDNYNSLTLKFAGNYTVEFRAYDDGVAYRFVTDIKGDITVLDEAFSVDFVDNNTIHMQQNNSFKTGYEHPYRHVLSKVYTSQDEMANLPVLVDAHKSYKILFSEADLYDYPCMFLKSNDNNGLKATFPKVPIEFGEDGDRSVKILKEGEYIAQTKGKRSFPWRSFIITNDDKNLIGNDMIYKLSSPNRLDDISWIKPGQVSWEWWHDAALYGVDFISGYNMDSYKYYIDFAANFGIKYIIMDEGWAKSTRDPFTPNSTIDIHELIQYGKDKGVDIVLWLTWLTVENNMETVFKTFSEWGVAGVKIDFMDRSDQWMVNYYERVAIEAAKYEILVNFHGAFKPAGLERAYPNVLGYEGVLGLEQGPRCTPDNSLYLPFIRNVVGPMDFTPGAMLNGQPENLGYTRIKPVGTGTRCFQLSTFVVFESGLQMLADNPYNYYREKECTDFISNVPVTWDETMALHAIVGQSVIVAKRHNKQWYMGGMVNNAAQERLFQIDLDFLEEGVSYKMMTFEDGINAARQAADYKSKESIVNKGDVVSVRMVRNGGFAASLTPITNLRFK